MCALLLDHPLANAVGHATRKIHIFDDSLGFCTGASLAELDTATEPAGVGAAVEGSDISNEDQKTVRVSRYLHNKESREAI